MFVVKLMQLRALVILLTQDVLLPWCDVCFWLKLDMQRGKMRTVHVFIQDKLIGCRKSLLEGSIESVENEEKVESIIIFFL